MANGRDAKLWLGASYALISGGAVLVGLAGFFFWAALSAIGPEDDIPISWWLAPLLVGAVCIVTGILWSSRLLRAQLHPRP